MVRKEKVRSLKILKVVSGMGLVIMASHLGAAPVGKEGGRAEDIKIKTSGNGVKTSEMPVATPSRNDPVFAMANGKAIAVSEFSGLLAETMRKRYYHGTIPEGKGDALYKEITELIIDQELLVAEAEKRGITPEAEKYEKTLALLDVKYADEPEWQLRRAQLLPQLKKNMDRQSMLEQLEKKVREVPKPTAADVRAYYDKKPELFTEPERLRVSVILLKVDPGANKTEWDRIRDEAQKIVDRIKNGADFAEQARLHSQHDSAANGGDLGYLHGGMLPKGLEDRIGKFLVGVTNEPVVTLEGVLIARIDDRILPKLRQFSEVEQRAQDLLIRDQADQAWKNTISNLRAVAQIKIITPQVAPEIVN